MKTRILTALEPFANSGTWNASLTTDIQLALTAGSAEVFYDGVSVASGLELLNGSLSDVQSIYIDSAKQVFQLDDIYVVQTIPEPATLGLIAMASGALLLIRRTFTM